MRFCGYDAAGRLHELPRQELVLFTPLLPESENPYGVSLLRGLPFMADILMKIDRVGRDMRMAQGMCGSLSGSVPTNVGQPMIRVSSITVGGRA